MNFPGSNELKLSDAALTQAIESALNRTRLAGEDSIRVTDISRSYSYGPWTVTITTDPLPIEVPQTLKVAA